MKSKLVLFFLILCCIALLFFIVQRKWTLNDNSTEITHFTQIPSKDKKKMEFFFRHFFVLDHMGYVLMGKKAIAISSFQSNFIYFKNKKIHFAWNYFIPCNLKLVKGYETWLKYEKVFPLRNFLIKKETSPWNGDQTFIFIINKKKFKSLLEEYIDDFEKELNIHIDTQKILDSLFKKNIIEDIFQKHDGLLGTMLGYGRNNAWKFHEEKQSNPSSSILSNPWESNKTYHDINAKIKSYGFWDQFIGNFSQDLSVTFLPQFRAIEKSGETKALKIKYLKTRKKLLSYYQDKDFLEATLLFLCEKDGF